MEERLAADPVRRVSAGVSVTVLRLGVVECGREEVALELRPSAGATQVVGAVVVGEPTGAATGAAGDLAGVAGAAGATEPRGLAEELLDAEVEG